MDLISHDDEYTLRPWMRCRRKVHGVAQIARPVCAEFVGGAHRTGQHHRLVAPHGQVQKQRRLFKRVRAVRDDNSVHILVRQQDVDACGELQPDGVGHVLTADVGDLLADDMGVLPDLGYGADQCVDREFAGAVGCALVVARRGGDGAAGGENVDARQVLRMGEGDN